MFIVLLWTAPAMADQKLECPPLPSDGRGCSLLRGSYSDGKVDCAVGEVDCVRGKRDLCVPTLKLLTGKPDLPPGKTLDVLCGSQQLKIQAQACPPVLPGKCEADEKCETKLRECEDRERALPACKSSLSDCEKAKAAAVVERDSLNEKVTQARELERREHEAAELIKAELAKRELELKECRQELRPNWMKVTAFLVAGGATLWTVAELFSLRSASDSYANAPMNAPDIGTRHANVVEARGWAMTAGAASLVAWGWSLSLVW